MNDLWIIIGASSSIARAFAHEAAQAGASILLAGRDVDDLDRTAADIAVRYGVSAGAVYCDVSDAQSRADLAAFDTQGERVNVMLAAGSMPEQEDMENDEALLNSMIAATYSGPVTLINALAPKFETQQGGALVVIGSVAGDRGRKKNHIYGSAKAGLATYAEGLRARLFPAGASVTIVKPGFVDTAMTWGLPGLFLVSTPQAAANAIFKAAQSGKPELYHPFFWRWIMLIIRFVPSAIMKRLNF